MSFELVLATTITHSEYPDLQFQVNVFADGCGTAHILTDEGFVQMGYEANAWPDEEWRDFAERMVDDLIEMWEDRDTEIIYEGREL